MALTAKKYDIVARECDALLNYFDKTLGKHKELECTDQEFAEIIGLNHPACGNIALERNEFQKMTWSHNEFLFQLLMFTARIADTLNISKRLRRPDTEPDCLKVDKYVNEELEYYSNLIDKFVVWGRAKYMIGNTIEIMVRIKLLRKASIELSARTNNYCARQLDFTPESLGID
jgi:hypothetical protein